VGCDKPGSGASEPSPGAGWSASWPFAASVPAADRTGSSPVTRGATSSPSATNGRPATPATACEASARRSSDRMPPFGRREPVGPGVYTAPERSDEADGDRTGRVLARRRTTNTAATIAPNAAAANAVTRLLDNDRGDLPMGSNSEEPSCRRRRAPQHARSFDCRHTSGRSGTSSRHLAGQMRRWTPRPRRRGTCAMAWH
jgi:hypothetical protein